MENKYKILIIGFVSLLFFGLFLLSLSPINQIIDYCEDNGWDGSEYKIEIGIYGKEEISILCNKESIESDAIVGIINGLYFWEKR